MRRSSLTRRGDSSHPLHAAMAFQRPASIKACIAFGQRKFSLRLRACSCAGRKTTTPKSSGVSEESRGYHIIYFEVIDYRLRMRFVVFFVHTYQYEVRSISHSCCCTQCRNRMNRNERTIGRAHPYNTHTRYAPGITQISYV